MGGASSQFDARDGYLAADVVSPTQSVADSSPGDDVRPDSPFFDPQRAIRAPSAR
jgi:hypothetical protein